ncbi:hypothetical protein B9Z35_06080 [Limnohabitans sp. Jir61]|uniref:YqaJ viral recombinase family nuclease n=1 Tax=Limnohabitans sp. Jir61 TaxID=1826168 RepID=UPI000D340049|nr:YqaJ viral recombinase family protein [Limnohabitans sp. Jir61]PUE33086.1 hypothetical protein B9Z35_06080 [Limnohabitans sp. Jir61]
MTNDVKTTRHQGIGGSDVAALLGMSPYKTPLELWAEKVGHPGVAEKDELHLRFGKYLEPFVVEEFEKQTGFKAVEHSDAVFHAEHHFMYGHIDRFVVNEAWEPAVVEGSVVAKSLLECKTASAYSKDEWGPAGTDQVPRAYLLQCIWYMAITGCSTAHIAVLIGNADFRTYQINRDEKLEALVIEQAKRFWYEHVIAGVPPKPKNVDDVKMLYPAEKPDHSVEATPDLLASLNQLRQTQEESKLLDAKTETIKTQIMNAMADAEKLTFNGQLLATWKSAKPTNRIDTNVLKKQFPDIASQCMVTAPAQRRFLMKD